MVFNQGNDVPGDDRFGVVFGTLDPPLAAIPAVGTTFAIGEALVGAGAVEARVMVDATTETTDTFNVIADTPTGRDDRTVVVGAHLDSVQEGPGINDNGTGTAAVLETAVQMAELGIAPRNTVRFAFWGGEEDGLIGSEYYVSQLSKAQIKQHSVNLNFDMLGSVNAVRFVYDGDGDAFGTTGPNGSDVIEGVFDDYFASQGLETEPTEFDGRSDYFAFINNGIPAGGLFSGAEGLMTAAGGHRLRRHRRRAVRPVLPPGLRHDRQRRRGNPRGARGRGGARHPHVRADDLGGQRHGEGQGGRPVRPGVQGSPGPALIGARCAGVARATAPPLRVLG